MRCIRIFFWTFALSLFFNPLTGKARNSSGKPGFPEKFLPSIQVNIWGIEANVYTYGMAVSIPFLWIHDRVKFAPLAGFFWDDVADGKFRSSEFAYGAKILYYFPSKSEFIRESNHFYVGAVGMGTDYLYGDGREERSRSGLIAGFEHFLNSNIKIGTEVQAGFNGIGDVYGALGLAIGLEWGYH